MALLPVLEMESMFNIPFKISSRYQKDNGTAALLLKNNPRISRTMSALPVLMYMKSQFYFSP